MHAIKSFQDVVSAYDGFLFDAFGVLMNGKGAIHNAVQCFNNLQDLSKSVYVVTNGSSKLEPHLEKKYKDIGLNINKNQIISSGGLLRDHLGKYIGRAKKVAVMGTKDSVKYVQQSNLDIHVETIHKGCEFDALVVANQTNYPLLECLDWAITHLIRRYDAQQPCPVIITNPDLFYPLDENYFGITAGSLGMIIESALCTRFLDSDRIHIIKLGKPHAPMFEAAVQRAGSRNLLMIGDQISTDVQGARNYGMDSLLVGSGLTPPELFIAIPEHKQPTYTIKELNWLENGL